LTGRLSLLVLVVLLCACSKAGSGDQGGSAGATQSKRGAPVARVGKVELYEADIQRAMARDPGASPARFETPEARRALIDGLVRFELLAQAADRAGLTKDPDAVHALQQIAVTKLVNQTLGAAATPESITQADVERDYLAHRASDYTLPPAAQVRRIIVSDEKHAARLTAQAKALDPADDRAFAKLASVHSQDAATRATGGDLGFVDENSRLPPALVTAALSLKAPGEIVGPIRTDAGFEILRLVTLRAAAVSPLSSVEQPIRQRLYRERRAKALDEYVARLREETKVEVVGE
jgi:peptidyl-prolyl cis-trans isomerase C